MCNLRGIVGSRARIWRNLRGIVASAARMLRNLQGIVASRTQMWRNLQGVVASEARMWRKLQGIVASGARMWRNLRGIVASEARISRNLRGPRGGPGGPRVRSRGRPGEWSRLDLGGVPGTFPNIFGMGKSIRKSPPPGILRTPPGRGKMPVFGSPPSRGHQQGTVSSRQQDCNSGNWTLVLVQGAANLRPTAWWPHKGAGGFTRNRALGGASVA